MTWNQINVGTPATDTSGDDEWDLDSQYSTASPPASAAQRLRRPLAERRRHPHHDQPVGHRRPSRRAASPPASATCWPTWLGLHHRPGRGAQAGRRPGPDDVLLQRRHRLAVPGDHRASTASPGVPDTNYPASSPYGIGVGGTSVLADNPLTEIAWYAGGGGLSPIEPAAPFQANRRLLGVAAPPTRGVLTCSRRRPRERVRRRGRRDGRGHRRHQRQRTLVAGDLGPRRGRARRSAGFAGPILYATVPASAFHDITWAAMVHIRPVPGTIW